VGWLIRIVAKALGGLLLAAMLVIALVLVEAHLEIRSVRPDLPDAQDLLALAESADLPVHIGYVNTASQGGAASPAMLGHPAFVLRWADGRRFLIDVGMEREQALAFGRVIEVAFGSDPIAVHGSVPEQLGPATARVRGVAFTHLHNDHTGGLPGLCRALERELPVFQTPWQADLGNYSTRPARAQLQAADCARFERLATASLAPIPGFPGLAALPAAGHTPGSTVFVARVGELTWVLAGDVTNFMVNLHEDRPKPRVYSLFVVPEAPERLARMRAWLRELAARPDFRVLVSHDLDAIRASGLPADGTPAS
jgi:glyoxylase-like metal-dependent hydrolase (beta-lactamase superfamily II)